jgi:hypothetical protein
MHAPRLQAGWPKAAVVAAATAGLVLLELAALAAGVKGC